MKVKRIKGLQYDIVRLRMLINLWWEGVKLYKNPVTAFKVVKQLVQRFSRLMGKKKLVRAFKVDGLYYWDMFNPGWPSKGFNAFFQQHLLEEKPLPDTKHTLRRLIVAITKRCPLNCEHCSEALTLNQKDVLPCSEFEVKIDKYVEEGVGQIIYSGGEPLSRFNDLISLLERYKGRCDQWIYTAAYGLTAEKARKLKQAGLNGAAISLDHHLESKHNDFRRNDKSYYWVLEGIKHLQNEGVLVAINVCPTREYIDSGSVEEIIKLAKELNVPIVNFLEPRAVGNYGGQDVELKIEHKKVLSDLSEKYNFSEELYDYPTVLFPAGYRDQVKCGGGHSYIFMDYDGQIYPCPFCKVKMPEVKPAEDVCVVEAYA